MPTISATIRSRSSADPNSTTILPRRRPISTRTLVWSCSERISSTSPNCPSARRFASALVSSAPSCSRARASSSGARCSVKRTKSVLSLGFFRRAWAAEYRVDPARGPLVAHGLPALGNVRRLRPDLSEDEATAAARYQLELEYVDVVDVTAAPGAHELLGELDRLGLPWAVVTSADPTLARIRLGAAGIRPALLVTIDDVRAGKPDPEGYLLAARKLGVDPRRCLVVEDAEAGVRAGQAAGAVVAALRGVPADIQLAGLGELTSLLRQAENPRA